MKALQVADEPLPWSSIGVRAGSGGGPEIELTGRAQRLAARSPADLDA
jgi:hypothetical protein